MKLKRARLALARACYAFDKEVYIFDDPLSAVDSHVAKHIYNSCICDLLANKTRILCTHHIDYLSNANTVIVIENEKIANSGPGNEIIHFLTNSKKSFKISQTEKTDSEDVDKISDKKSEIEEQTKYINEVEIKRQEEEEKEHGVINFQVYKYYCLSVGLVLTFLTLLTLALMQSKIIFFNLKNFLIIII